MLYMYRPKQQNCLLYRGYSLPLYDAKVFICSYRHLSIQSPFSFGSVENQNYSSVYLQLYAYSQMQSSKASCRTAWKSQNESESKRDLQRQVYNTNALF